jgi:hypothetical protein
MKTLNFECPTASAIRFRFSGTVSVNDGTANHVFKLDPANVPPDRRAVIQCQGEIIHDDKSGGPYSELQIFATPAMDAGLRVVSSSGVTDQKGKKIPSPSPNARVRLQFELDTKASPLPGESVSVAWMVDKVGKQRMYVKGDSKELRSADFVAKPRPQFWLSDAGIDTVVLNSYASVAPKSVLVGEVISFGFTLQELEKVKTLKLFV